MTYSDFLKGDYWRPVKGHPELMISNKGKLYNTRTGCFNKRSGKYGQVNVQVAKNKIKGFTLWYEVLKAFPDVDFTKEELQAISHVSKIERGAYTYPNPKCSKRWRAIISVQNKKKTLGYYHTRAEALKSYYAAFLVLRGFKPW